MKTQVIGSRVNNHSANLLVNKILPMEKAVAMIPTGSMLALGGMTLYRRPMAFVRALISHYQRMSKPDQLTLMTFTAGLESDLLIGAGMISCIRTCYCGLEIFGFAPMFTYYANKGQIQILEESEASLAFGLRATLAGVGFMPARAWLGTDLPKLRPDIKKVIDPYHGEELIAFPAIKPDVAVIHALKADQQGNVLIGDNRAGDEELAIASEVVIVTTEELTQELAKADLPAPLVDVVVLAPGGAKPTSCHPLYPIDGEIILSYVEQVSDPSSYNDFINRISWF